MKNYLRNNPNATLQEYSDYLRDLELKEVMERRQREEADDIFYKSIIGKYILINFNGTHYSIFKIHDDPRNTRIDFVSLGLVKSDGGYWSLSREVRPFNHLWVGPDISGWQLVESDIFEKLLQTLNDTTVKIKETLGWEK